MKVYMVGGCVRDLLLGNVPKDIDYVVVGSTPEKMAAMGFKPVGADFPVFLDTEGNEFALARTERKSGRGYHGFVTNHSPEVTLVDDLHRRDLTINAMALDPDMEKNVFDPFDGKKDLEDKVLRHVSEAFADDPVRVLRLARFHARFGSQWRVAPETLALCKGMVASGELDHLTMERVVSELLKALSEPEPDLFFMSLHQCGALPVVFPPLKGKIGVIHFNLGAPTVSKSPLLNWAKLTTLVDDAEAFEELLSMPTKYRRYSKMFRSLMSTPVGSHPVDALYSADAFRRGELFHQVMTDALESCIPLGHLQRAYDTVKHVSFNTLPETVKLRGRGEAISRAIKEQRLFAFESAMR